ncbi:MAG: glycine betaine ABC transporter substrate-binding protein [Thermoleophilia bacterium]
MNRRVRLIGVGLIAAMVLSLAMLAAGCGDDDDDTGGSSTPTTAGATVDGTVVRIADKQFPESEVVADIYAQALEAIGYKAKRTSLASSDIAFPAIKKGDIDLYPEYTGTAYGVLLKKTDVPAPDALYQAIKTAFAAQGLTTLTPSPYSNDNRVACTKEAADQYGLATLSDLGAQSANITYSANAEHLTRADGLPLLKKEYGFTPKEIKTVAIGLRYKPIEDGQANCVYAFGTDPQIASLGLVVLEDDKGVFQGLSYQNFPVINTAFFDAQPPIFAETLDKIDAALTDEVVSGLNAKTQLDEEDPEDVAADFLASAGIQ